MKRILITGITSGIGLATAQELIKGEYHLIFGVRNVQKAAQMAKTWQAQNDKLKIDILHVDLASLKSIREFADSINKNFDSIDILVNNAGVFADKKMYTQDGYELTLGVNFIGTYYLTKLLLDKLESGDNPQVINIGSRAGMFGKFKLKDGAFVKQPHGFRAYSASKFLQLMTSIYMARHLDTKVKINTVHPGDAATNIWNGDSILMKIVGPMMKKSLSTPQQAAEAGLYLIANPPKDTGKFYEKQGIEIEFSKYDDEFAKNVINATDNLIEGSKE